MSGWESIKALLPEKSKEHVDLQKVEDKPWRQEGSSPSTGQNQISSFDNWFQLELWLAKLDSAPF